MNYLVMECHDTYAVLLDEDGIFVKAANLHYKVGQTVEDPVLMKEAAPKKLPTVRWVIGFAAIVTCFIVVFGFGYYQSYLAPYSSIFLSINPEVRLELNRQGTVVGLTGMNDDGATLLDGYQGKGKDKVTVADELIERAIEMGFLSEGGRVSFAIDAPDEVLFDQYVLELQTKVAGYMNGRLPITIEITNCKDGNQDDLDDDMEDDSSSSTVASQPSAIPPRISSPIPAPSISSSPRPSSVPSSNSDGDDREIDDQDDCGDDQNDDDDGWEAGDQGEDDDDQDDLDDEND